MTEKVSDLTSLPMCVAGTSQGSADYTPSASPFSLGAPHLNLKQLSKRRSLHCQAFPGSLGVSFVDTTLFITRWQESRSPGQMIAAIGQAQGTESEQWQCGEKLCGAVRLIQHCQSSLENSPEEQSSTLLRHRLGTGSLDQQGLPPRAL